MEKSKVAVIHCDTYNREQVKNAVYQAIDLLGGIDSLFQIEESIVIKPNLLRKSIPEQGIITHPMVFSAVGEYLQSHGFHKLSYGDSPGVGQPERIVEEAGMEAEAKRLGISLGDFGTGVTCAFPQGNTAKEFVLCQEVANGAAIVNVCKMKTHALERITGAVKNMYGCIQGMHKKSGHAKYTDPESFARMLVDLNLYLKPRLHIMDGIVAMEGNGPASGTPVKMGVLLASYDPVALDSIFAKLIYVEPETVPTIYYGQRMGLGNGKIESIQILTEKGTVSIEELVNLYGKPEFDVYRGEIKGGGQKKVEWLLKRFRQKPYILEERCIHCGVCVGHCPLEKKALEFKNGKEHPPVYDYQLCIRCFCCQEMCPEKAIEIKTPLLRKVLDRMYH